MIPPRRNHEKRFELPRREYYERIEHPYGVAQHELDRHVKLDVLDFYGGQDPGVSLDWINSIQSFFSWHDIPEGRHLKFAKVKLKDTARLWWENYEEEHRRLGVLRYWEDLRATMKRRFKPPSYRQKAHLELTHLRQGTASIETYTAQF